MTNAFFNDQNTIALDHECIENLKRVAQSHPQKCARYCLHSDNKAGVQEMLLVMHKDSRFAPHRHPKHKSESLHIIDGKVGMSEFNDLGNVTQQHLLSRQSKFLFRIQGGIWHLPVALTEWVVFHEVFHGPYNKKSDVELHTKYASKQEINLLYEQLKSQFKEMENNE